MADIEKVMKALENCANDGNCRECVYFEKAEWSINCPVDNDALALLKKQQKEIERLQEQVPKNGKWIFTGQKNAYGGTVIQCPFCDDKYAASDPGSEHYCRNCGAKLMD